MKALAAAAGRHLGLLSHFSFWNRGGAARDTGTNSDSARVPDSRSINKPPGRLGSHPVISTFILIIMALQAGTFVYGSKLWPFLVYSMYRDSYPGPEIHTWQQEMFAITKTGKRLKIASRPQPQVFTIFRTAGSAVPDVVGLNDFAINKLYRDPILSGDSGAVKRLAESVDRVLSNDHVVKIEIQSQRVVLKKGNVLREKKTIVTYPVGP